jgi:hypothetical protein
MQTYVCYAQTMRLSIQEHTLTVGDCESACAAYDCRHCACGTLVRVLVRGLFGPFLVCFVCRLWLWLPLAAATGPVFYFLRALVFSCPAVCPLCWLPRRLVYVRRVRTID